MTQGEIKEGNELIAKYMGKSYILMKTAYHVNPYPYSMSDGHGGYEALKYEKSWDWMWPVIDKINGLGKEYSFATFKTYASCTVEKGGKVFKDFNFAHAEYITATQTSQEAVYKLLVKFIKWENERN